MYTECDCSSSVGADASVTCATFGGQCSCLGGVTGLLCDVCRNGWFNYSDTGCQGRQDYVQCNATLVAIHPVVVSDSLLRKLI